MNEKQERPDGWCNLDDEGQVRQLLRRLRDYDVMADNLKAAQERCSELLEDSRQKGRRIKVLEAELEALREKWLAKEEGDELNESDLIVAPPLPNEPIPLSRRR